jgi:hypothetical protein
MNGMALRLLFALCCALVGCVIVTERPADSSPPPAPPAPAPPAVAAAPPPSASAADAGPERSERTLVQPADAR